MVDEISSTELIAAPSYDVQLQNFEIALLDTLRQSGLPTKSVFVEVSEKLAVSKNIGNVLTKLAWNKDKDLYTFLNF